MKVRIGFGLGTGGVRSIEETFGPLVDDLERLRFDSLWLSERLTGEAPDPVVGMAFAAGRTRKLKFGMSVMVLPGRNPILVAKELATLDRLSNGRLLPAFGLGVADPREHQAFGVERKERARMFDEALPLIRRLWEEDVVDHAGKFYQYEGIEVRPKPVQKPLEVWHGGNSAAELRRTGRLADGWLPSFCIPADVAAARLVVEQEADAHGRAIDPEHWGALIPYTRDAISDRLRTVVAARRPDLDPEDMIPVGLGALRSQIERFIDVGFSKFVVVPVFEPQDWTSELEELAAEALTLQN